ncbi:hypothetical protein AB1Y20_002673 [Prymnesium parvum]|uniref:Glycolipid transfer protein domain-containing protein n=1 Tax=Prymnesium parvum TaxID=97485 RepID=A0AB34JBP8_PRYPA
MAVAPIVLELPPLPAVEALLLLIALLLARVVWLLADGVAILRKAGSAPLETKAARARGGSVSESSRIVREARSVERTLRSSAKMFELCYLGDADMDVDKFMEACRWYGDKVLTQMGSFTLVTVREIHANMDKVKHTHQLDPQKHRSMHALLETECASDMHQPGGILLDQSAAMGLLWARRGLMFWVCLFRRHLDQAASGPATPTGSQTPSSHATVIAAYEESLAPFNGWVTRNTFMLATRAFPEWREIEATLASTPEEAKTDMSEWVHVVEPLLDRMDATLRKLDLNDTRKCL